MQVSVEPGEGLERKIIVDIEAEQIDGEVKKRLQHLAKTQRMNGFRPGKIPLAVVKKRFGEPVRQEVVADVMNRSFYQAVSEKELNPAGFPLFEQLESEEGKDLKYSATFEVYPEIELSDFSKLKLETVKAEVADDDLATMLDTLRAQQGEWVEVKRKAKEDDQLMLNFVGTIDGVEFEGGTGNDVPLVLGSGSMIPGFEDQLLGATANSEIDIKVTFPEDYNAKELAGKDAVFATKVLSVSKRDLPTLTELAEKLNASDGIKGLKADVRKNMERELATAVSAKNKEAVMDALLESNEVVVPKAPVDQEIERMRQEAAQQFGQKGNLPELPAALFEEQANKRVKLGLLVAEVIRQKEIKAEADEVKARLEELAGVYERPEEVVNYYLSDQNRLREIESLVLEDKVVELVVADAKTEEVELSFDEVLNPVKKDA